MRKAVDPVRLFAGLDAKVEAVACGVPAGLFFEKALQGRALERGHLPTSLNRGTSVLVRQAGQRLAELLRLLCPLKPVWSRAPATASCLRGRIEEVLNTARARGHIDPDRPNPARWRGHLDHLLPNPSEIGERSHHADLRVRAERDRASLSADLIASDVTFLIPDNVGMGGKIVHMLAFVRQLIFAGTVMKLGG